MQEAHEQVLDLVPVQFVTAQERAAQGRRTLVLIDTGREGERQRSEHNTGRRFSPFSDFFLVIRIVVSLMRHKSVTQVLNIEKSDIGQT